MSIDPTQTQEFLQKFKELTKPRLGSNGENSNGLNVATVKTHIFNGVLTNDLETLITQCAKQDGDSSNMSEEEFKNVLSQIKENTLRKMGDKTYHVLDENGFLTEVYDTDDEGNVVNHRTYERNENGQAVKIIHDNHKENGTAGPDGKPDAVWTYEYNSDGMTVKEEFDYGADGPDGIPEEIVEYKYDANNKKIKEEHDIDGDGKADEIYTYIYDDNGNHIATGVDNNADKVIDRFLNKED